MKILIRVLLNKLKAKITGVVPCVFDSVSGHEFRIAQELPEKLKLNDSIKHECTVCGKTVYYDRLLGCFVSSGG